MRAGTTHPSFDVLAIVEAAYLLAGSQP